MRTPFFSLLAGSLLVLTGCGGEYVGPTTSSPVVPVVTAVNVSITWTSNGGLATTWQYQATAVAGFSDATTQDVTRQATWTSSNPMVATVAPDGSITAHGEGWTEIRAAHRSVIGTVSLGIGVGPE